MENIWHVKIYDKNKSFILSSLHLKNFPGCSEHSENSNYVQNFKVKLRQPTLWLRHKKMRWAWAGGLYPKPHICTQETWQQTLNTLIKSHALFQVKPVMDFCFHTDQVTTHTFFELAWTSHMHSWQALSYVKMVRTGKKANINCHVLTNCNQIIQQGKVPMKIIRAAPLSKGGAPHVPYKHFKLGLCVKDRKVSHSSGSVLKSMEQSWLTPADDPANEDREVFWFTFTSGDALRTSLLQFNGNGYAYSLTTI